MPPKRTADSSLDFQNGGSGVHPPHAGEEFTRAVKKRLSASTRTGQACDRCKVRKIRCDGLPGGCSPCMQNKTECKTTDRISQKAVPRGYLENLEAKCQELEMRNKELQAALIAMEASTRTAANGFAPFEPSEWTMNGTAAPPRMPVMGSGDRWTMPEKPHTNQQLNVYPPMNGATHSSAPPPATGNRGSASHIPTASFRPGNSSMHYLGISAGNSYLSSMRAHALSLLGIDIDLSALDPSEPASGRSSTQIDESFGSCLATIFNSNPSVIKTELPPRDEAMQYINYFFMISHPYLPILHRPTFISMVERIYNDKSFEPTAAQTVQVHMVLAIVHFQNAAYDRMKNKGQSSPASKDVMERSRRHYHYAISLFYDLLSSASLEDVQAIGLILQHLRAFPKPGGSWLLSRMAVSMCLELGLHRSAKKWIYNGGKINYIEIEVRKRVFWCIFTLEVSLASKLGRPMSVRCSDFDVEYPEPIDDQYILEKEILKRDDGAEGCEFDVAIQLFKYATLSLQIHSTLYGVAKLSSDKYVELVQDMESKLENLKRNHPKSISLDSPRPERKFQAAHLHAWYHESRILMRHPSLSLSPSPSFTNECTRICVESSREILRTTDSLRKGNHYLDTTWYGATIQLLATLTILFSVWEKKDIVTAEEVAQVKADMDVCMEIMGDLGSLLGAPNRLKNVVQVLTQGTMELLNQKPDQTKRSPPCIPRVSSTGSKPSLTASSALYPPTVAVPSVPLKLEYAQSQPTAYPEPRITIFGDSLANHPDSVYDNTSTTGVGGTTNTNGPLFSLPQSGYSPTTAPYTQNDTSPHQPPTFSWSWTADESWRRYMQSLSSMAENHSIGNINENLDPSETYASSALIGLSQDCQSFVTATGTTTLVTPNNGFHHNSQQQQQHMHGHHPDGPNSAAIQWNLPIAPFTTYSNEPTHGSSSGGGCDSGGARVGIANGVIGVGASGVAVGASTGTGGAGGGGDGITGSGNRTGIGRARPEKSTSSESITRAGTSPKTGPITNLKTKPSPSGTQSIKESGVGVVVGLSSAKPTNSKLEPTKSTTRTGSHKIAAT